MKFGDFYQAEQFLCANLRELTSLIASPITRFMMTMDILNKNKANTSLVPMVEFGSATMVSRKSNSPSSIVITLRKASPIFLKRK